MVAEQRGADMKVLLVAAIALGTGGAQADEALRREAAALFGEIKAVTGSLGFASKDAGVAKLTELDYLPKFRAAFPDDAQPLSAANYGRALQSYQATLTTPAAFDRFLGGDDGALTERQKKGLRTFMATGCAGCHNGANFGGATLQKFGVTKDYWLETGSPKPDVGRFAATKQEED